LMLTMLLGGLWHGAGLNFLIWGGLHGLYLSINHLWQTWRGAEAKASSDGSGNRLAQALSWALTFFAVVIAWVFFRAKTASGAWQMLCALFGFEAGRAGYVSPGVLRVMDLPLFIGEEGLMLIGSGVATLALAIALLLPNVAQLFRYREYRRAPESSPWPQWQPNFIWALFAATAFAISLFGMWQRLEFLYFQF
jgi:alginate O-acetyltransferase complex protein AlgI